MKGYPRQGRPLHRSSDPALSGKGRLLKTGVISFILHIAVILFLMLNLRSILPQNNSVIYRVTLMPFSPSGGVTAPGPPLASQPSEKISAPLKTETVHLDQGSKEKDIIAKVKTDSKKTEKKEGVPKKEVPEGLKKTDTAKKKVEQAKDPDKSLQDTIEEIRQRVARRGEEEKLASKGLSKEEEGGEGRTTAGSSSGGLSPGGGTGTEGGASGSLVGGSKLDVYYGLVWTKIKKEWALPEDLSKANLETIIIFVIDRAGKIRKSWFEKKSGNVLYDQSAMRAIKKAEPFPPIPEELRDDTFAIRFTPEMAR